MKRPLFYTLSFAVLMVFSGAQTHAQPTAADPAAASSDSKAAGSGSKAASSDSKAVGSDSKGAYADAYGGEPEIKLLSAGKEPRKPIRFRPSVGDKRSMVMTMDIQQQITAGGAPLPSPKVPVQQVALEFTVADVADNGDVSLNYTYSDWEVLRGEGVVEQMAALIEQQVKPLVGTKGTLVLTDRGLPKDASIQAPEGLAPQMKALIDGSQDSIKQLGVAMPAEPIGIGAVWTVASQAKTNGIAMKQTFAYKLVSADEEGYKLMVKMKQEAGEQEVSPPGLPPQVKAKLTGFSSRGQGETHLAADSIVPEKFQVDMQSSSDMTIDLGGQTQAMNMNLTMKIGLSPATGDE